MFWILKYLSLSLSFSLSLSLGRRWVYEKEGMFRAEMEGEDGVVKGVYTVADQQGNVQTQAYISGGPEGGHRWAVYIPEVRTPGGQHPNILTDWSSSGTWE